MYPGIWAMQTEVKEFSFDKQSGVHEMLVRVSYNIFNN